MTEVCVVSASLSANAADGIALGPRSGAAAPARAALDAGQSIDQIAAAFGVSRATLYRNLGEHDEQQAAP